MKFVTSRSLVLLVPLLPLLSLTVQDPPLPIDNLPADMFTTKPPYGLEPSVPAPRENPLSKLKFELGRKIFFDPILSADKKVACASCHEPEHGFSSPASLPLGVHGKRAIRNAPTLFNRGFGKSQLWTGAAATLEDQVLLPIENPVEMGIAVDMVVKRLQAHEKYKGLFKEAFSEAPSRKTLAHALASFVRGLFLGDSPVDRFQGAEVNALNRQEKAGLWLYESKGRCWRCHSGSNFTDEGFHNTGVSAQDGKAVDGRFEVSKRQEDRGKFKTPTLRGLVKTGPYMHDGSMNSLEEVIEFYRKGGGRNSNLDSMIEPLSFSDDDAKNLLAFLRALSRKADK